MKRLVTFCFILISIFSLSQEKPAFWNDIQNFEQLNKDQPPAKNSILFLGSSSFTMWKDVNDYFPGKTIINRGFGGSSLYDLNLYSKELLQPYQPKQIVIYCGENDIANQVKPKAVANRFKHFYKEIRKYYPNIPVAYVSMKLSPSRENLWPQMLQANNMIKKYIAKQKNVEYIDITKIMEDQNGRTRNDLFLEDMLHMKPEGYRLWTKVMTPYLK